MKQIIIVFILMIVLLTASSQDEKKICYDFGDTVMSYLNSSTLNQVIKGFVLKRESDSVFSLEMILERINDEYFTEIIDKSNRYVVLNDTVFPVLFEVDILFSKELKRSLRPSGGGRVIRFNLQGEIITSENQN